MDKRRFCSLLQGGCEQLEIEVKEASFDGLFCYFSDLMRWSKKINLISKNSSEEEVVETHFLDSLTLLPLLTDSSHLVDVGTGAGLPGLVCKVAKPEISVSLVEPRLKRVSFLNHIVRMQQLENIDVTARRIEEYEPEPKAEAVTHITSRAVSEIGLFCSMVRHLARPGVKIVCMKGPRWEEELEKARRDDGLNIKNCNVTSFVLPRSGAARSLVEFELV